MRLKDKVAIITGGAVGIGYATAMLFALEGARIAIADINIAEGNRTAAKIIKNGKDAIFIKADVTKVGDVEALVEHTVKTYNGIDILICNAGIMPEDSMRGVVDLENEVWDKVIDVNLKGVFLISKYVIPEMIKRGGGSIINMSSTHGHTAKKNRSVYVASKGGVTLLTKSMALDYALHKIRVNCICPGPVDTKLTGDFLETVRKDKRLWKELMLTIPLGRLGTPIDIAYAALFLASDESSWITGTSLMVDGGYTAQ